MQEKRSAPSGNIPGSDSAKNELREGQKKKGAGTLSKNLERGLDMGGGGMHTLT